MSVGYIFLHKNIQEHWIFKDPFFRWWTIILMQSNYQNDSFTLGYKLYKIEIGQCANSLRTWAKLFNCSTKQVDKFFKLLESDNMITRKVLGKGKQSTTLINITNFKQYQFKEETQGTTKDTTQGNTIKKREVRTTKEYKEYKNNRIEEVNIIFDNILMSEIEISDLEESQKFHFKISNEFRLLFIKNLEEKNSPTKNQTEAKFKHYVNPIRLMMERGEVTREQLLKVYSFLDSDKAETEQFSWKQNILSTKKLREKFQQLSIRANKDDNNPSGTSIER